MFRTVVITSLAVASVANGASVCDSAVTINSASDLSQLSSCTTLGDDLNINAATTDLASVSLTNIQSITGNLNVGGTQINTLAMPLLNSIGGTFNMTGLTALAQVTMGSLTSVGGIDWDTLGPQFQTLAFTQGISKAGGVNISNTFLQSLDGINVQNTADFDITNNKYLKTYSSTLKTVSNTLSLAANANNFTATFPNLIWANIVKFRDLTTLSIPSLVRVNGSLEVDENQFDTFSAPKLTNIDQSLGINNNPLLTNISLPVLVRTGGGLTVANNSDLVDVDGFPKLSQIIGAVDFDGAFTNASFPSIADVEGSFTFHTSAVFSCDTFESYSGNQVKGPVDCKGQTETTTSNGTSTTSGSGSSATSKSAGVSTYSAASFGAMFLAAVVGVLAL